PTASQAFLTEAARASSSLSAARRPPLLASSEAATVATAATIATRASTVQMRERPLRAGVADPVKAIPEPYRQRGDAGLALQRTLDTTAVRVMIDTCGCRS